jgi:hypothetical protein
MMELLDNMIKSAMTLETKRWRSLPWNFPLNHRKVSEGEKIVHRKVLTEGVYRWSVKSLPGDIVETVHKLPYTLDFNGNLYSYEPSLRKREVFAEEVNGFGPDDKPWRWMEKKKK